MKYTKSVTFVLMLISGLVQAGVGINFIEDIEESKGGMLDYSLSLANGENIAALDFYVRIPKGYKVVSDCMEGLNRDGVLAACKVDREKGVVRVSMVAPGGDLNNREIGFIQFQRSLEKSYGSAEKASLHIMRVTDIDGNLLDYK